MDMLREQFIVDVSGRGGGREGDDSDEIDVELSLGHMGNSTDIRTGLTWGSSRRLLEWSIENSRL